MFYKIFSNLCETRNIPKTKVLAEIGLSTGNLDKWKKGASINSDVIIKIAEFFEVSTDYILLGKENESNLTDIERELLALFRKLDHKQKERFIGKVEMIIEEMTELDTKTETGA